MREIQGEEKRLLQESVARFAEKEIAPHVEALNHYPDHPLPKDLVEGLASLGLFELLLPADAGGGGSDAATLSVALETLSETMAAAAGIVFAHSLAQQMVASASGKRGAERLFLSGENAGHTLLAYPAYTEPSDCDHGIKATKSGGAFILEGTCEFVVNAPIAGLLLLPVYQEDEDNRCSLALLKKDHKGVSIGESLLTLGMRGCPTADVTLSKVKVSAGELIPGACDLIRDVTARFRGPAAAICAGITGASLRTATGYAQERYQAGRYIIEHQQVRAMLAGMLGDYQRCCDAADRLSNGEKFSEAHSASLFIHAKEGAARATTDGVQLLGGYGYMEDYGQERCMRDAKQAQALLGRCGVLKQELITRWLESEAAL